jgi:hypothetical protein
METKQKKQRSPEEQAKIDRMLEGLRKKREADKLAKEQKKAIKDVPKPVEVPPSAPPVAPPNSLIETPLVTNKTQEEKMERWNKLYTKLDEIEKTVKTKAKSKSKKYVVEESSSDEEVIVVKKTKPKKIEEPEIKTYIEKPTIQPVTGISQKQSVPDPIVGSSEWLRKQIFGK